MLLRVSIFVCRYFFNSMSSWRFQHALGDPMRRVLAGTHDTCIRRACRLYAVLVATSECYIICYTVMAFIICFLNSGTVGGSATFSGRADVRLRGGGQ